MDTKALVCDICGKKRARQRRVTKSYGTGRSAFLIEGVPVITCSACGESHITAETLREVKRIRQHWRQLAVKKTVPVARFRGAGRLALRTKKSRNVAPLDPFVSAAARRVLERTEW